MAFQFVAQSINVVCTGKIWIIYEGFMHSLEGQKMEVQKETLQQKAVETATLQLWKLAISPTESS